MFVGADDGEGGTASSVYDADPTRRGRDTADFTAMAVKVGLALGA
ncbi:hypothetical protein [Streptomyces sp. NPDC056672]